MALNFLVFLLHGIVRLQILAHLEGYGTVGRRGPSPEQLDLLQVVLVHLQHHIPSDFVD